MASESATMLATEERMMTATQTGRTYRITISLPLGYSKAPDEGWPFNKTPDLWPVVYVLDGNWYAGMVAGIIRPMAWCGSTTDAIVVGIGYEETGTSIEAFWTSMTRRNIDLTPIRDEDAEKMVQPNGQFVPTGDASGFLAFIKNDLIPTIERDYRADPARRILVGHSYGGLFGLFSLFESPDLFETLIIGSPTLTYGNGVMWQREKAFAEGRTTLTVKMYLYVGELEEDVDDTCMTDTLRLVAILKGRNYEGFSLVKHVFLDQNHCEVAAPGFQGGLKFTLKTQA
jgi:predicted alpha/beta superfamily hydrolase